MKQLSESGIQVFNAIAQQHDFSGHAVLHMHEALTRREGRMAQFNHQEFGGAGQWMTGGMTVASGNYRLTVAAPHADPSQGAPTNEIFAKIQKLADLRARGLVNEQDFERRKNELLDHL